MWAPRMQPWDDVAKHGYNAQGPHEQMHTDE